MAKRTKKEMAKKPTEKVVKEKRANTTQVV
jgi:hypothetical protein